eukprot:CAMPEP_0115165638 /NCGR_PEP_ID=MMETSP0227-20121206/73700_1 /TAXON_ID=89957 /ORGANISM="Polarella glacialis, Strain CCMP 1383" /LENGTH=46 /DNA_ID= /DNA_START= /DNA_END= /DNA_ORIENTATION=
MGQALGGATGVTPPSACIGQPTGGTLLESPPVLPPGDAMVPPVCRK